MEEELEKLVKKHIQNIWLQKNSTAQSIFVLDEQISFDKLVLLLFVTE
jgi:hypothetical protein